MRTGEKTPVSFANVPVQVVGIPVVVSRGGMRQYKVKVSIAGLSSVLPENAPTVARRRETISVTVADKPSPRVRPGAWVEFSDPQAMQFCVTTRGGKWYGLSWTATRVDVELVPDELYPSIEGKEVSYVDALVSQ